jgi:hypothetical protein
MNITWTVEGLERYPVNLQHPRKLRESLEGFKRAQALLDEQIHPPTSYTLAWYGQFEHLARAAERLRPVVREPGGCPINHR